LPSPEGFFSLLFVCLGVDPLFHSALAALFGSHILLAGLKLG